MPDLYTTSVLHRVVASLKRPQNFLLNTFFPGFLQSETEEINFDTEHGARRIAPFVHPLVEGKTVEGLGFTANTFKPAYTKDRRTLDSSRPLKRAMGEQIGPGTLSGAQRAQAYLAGELADAVAMLSRRKEVMASEALRTGKVTVDGDGYDAVEVDYGRAAANTKTLSGAANWDAAGVSPLEDIETWSLDILKLNGAQVTDVVMEVDAWRLFILDSEVKNSLDYRRDSSIAGMFNTTPGQQQVGGEFKGTIGNRRYWTYADWYVDDAGSEVAILPQYQVLLGSSGIEGYQAHGAIRDEEHGFIASEFASKSWTTPDPSVRHLLVQSAPLVVPYRPDASMGVICKS